MQQMNKKKIVDYKTIRHKNVGHRVIQVNQELQEEGSIFLETVFNLLRITR
jgi:hypothetical protein